jgi:hypothetical protein
VRSAVAVGGLPTLREEVSPVGSHVASPSPAAVAASSRSLGMTGALAAGERPAVDATGVVGLGRAPSVAAPEAAAEEIPLRGADGELDKDEIETASVAGSAPGALDAGDMEARMVDMLDVVGRVC